MKNKTDYVKEIITELSATGTKIWIRVAKELSKPARNKPEVNLSKIDKMAKEGFVLVIPGKVLGTGLLSKKVDVAAYQFSEAAKTKIVAAGGKALTLEAVAKTNKDGKKLVLIK